MAEPPHLYVIYRLRDRAADRATSLGIQTRQPRICSYDDRPAHERHSIVFFIFIKEAVRS